jgi:hypothetical protein
VASGELLRAEPDGVAGRDLFSFDDAPKDRNGAKRGEETTPGPIELP